MNQKEKSESLNTLRRFLGMPHRAKPVMKLFETLPHARRYHGEETGENFVYIPPTRSNAVLLVAHADVCVESDQSPVLLEEGDVIRNKNGLLGADDRAGCAMLWLLRNSGHGLLITDGEENGMIGSEFLRRKHPTLCDEINSRYQFMVQIDRCNGREYKCYDVGTDEFRAYVEAETGYTEPDRKNMTDITVLCSDVCGVNLSCGYYREHYTDEYLKKSEWLHTLAILQRWLNKPELGKFAIIRDKAQKSVMQ